MGFTGKRRWATYCGASTDPVTLDEVRVLSWIADGDPRSVQEVAEHLAYTNAMPCMVATIRDALAGVDLTIPGPHWIAVFYDPPDISRAELIRRVLDPAGQVVDGVRTREDSPPAQESESP